VRIENEKEKEKNAAAKPPRTSGTPSSSSLYIEVLLAI
jgi:hypothetical protein